MNTLGVYNLQYLKHMTDTVIINDDAPRSVISHSV